MTTQWFLRCTTLAIALAALALLAVGSSPALGAGITVNTTDDELNDDGDCSLREAISSANLDSAVDACTAGSGADVITVPAGTYTIGLAGDGEDDNETGDFDVLFDTTINGAGSTSTIIDGGGLDRVFHFWVGNGSLAVTLSSLTVQNGGLGQDGGGIAIDAGTVVLNSVVVTGNSGDDGGGIDNDGALEINDSTISNNETDAGDDGGGIRSTGTLTVARTTFSGNTADDGGGGGLSNFGEAVIENSTFSGNSTIGAGGGILNLGLLDLNNVTIAGNSAQTGGGISDSDISVKGARSVVPGEPEPFVSAGLPDSEEAVRALGGGGVLMTNTIVAGNNTGGDCEVQNLTSNGHNLDGDATCGLTGTGDQSDADPQLSALAGNGGPTQTQALAATSPAVDAGDPATCLATDQRGISRPQDGNNDASAVCDIGAFELEPVPASGTPTLAPATQTPAGLPQTGSSPDGSGGSNAWFAIAAAGIVAALAAFWIARRRLGSPAG
jgi:CSLREA domain-containing protein